MEQLTLNISTVKQEIRERLNRAAQDFVFIGYRLRQINDTGAYAQEGYADIYAFAKAEFGLVVSSVSRFMAINKKYSVGGYGEELRLEFQNYGSSKLAEMLTLSDADCALIEEKTPVSQIRDFKGFLKNEPKEEIAGQMGFMNVPGIDETAAGGENTEAHELKPLLVDYFTSHTEILKAIFRGIDTESLYEEMNITGSGTYKHKTIFLFMYDYDTGIAYRVFGRPSPEKLSWAEFHEIIKTNLEPDYEAILEAAAAKEAEAKEIERAKKEAEQKVKEKKDERNKDKQNKGSGKQIHKTEMGNVKTADKVGTDIRENPVIESPADSVKGTNLAAENKVEENEPERIPGAAVEPDATPQEANAVYLGKTSLADIATGNVPRPTEEELANGIPVEIEPPAAADEPVQVITDAEVVDERHIASEIDLTFNERIQTAESILTAVKRDNKSEARMYCHELLRLLGDFE